jgi:hypothetical protein
MLDPTLPPHLREWLEQLRKISSREITAWVNDSWDLLSGHPQPASWSAQETELAIALIRPSREELQEFVDDQGFELEDESEFDESSYVWRDFVSGARPVVVSGVAQPVTLFSVTMSIDGGAMSSIWSWTAVQLTGELALLCARSDDWGLWTFPHPLGVITCEDAYRSAALLLASAEMQDYDRFGKGTDFLDELRAEGISDEEVYRLLLVA